jgi:hypothetical protein
MQTFELIDTSGADYVLDSGGLHDRFVEIDPTTLAPVTTAGHPIREGSLGWPAKDVIEWLSGRGVSVVELDG